VVKVNAHYVRATNFAILVIALVALIAMLTGLLYVIFAKAASASSQAQGTLLRVAWLIGATLMLTVLILLGVVIHYVAQRLTQPPEGFKPTAYFDAWSEAGRRVKAEDAPPVEPYEKEDS
jgi:uncharacterized membrane protein